MGSGGVKYQERLSDIGLSLRIVENIGFGKRNMNIKNSPTNDLIYRGFRRCLQLIYTEPNDSYLLYNAKKKFFSFHAALVNKAWICYIFFQRVLVLSTRFTNR